MVIELEPTDLPKLHTNLVEQVCTMPCSKPMFLRSYSQINILKSSTTALFVAPQHFEKYSFLAFRVLKKHRNMVEDFQKNWKPIFLF